MTTSKIHNGVIEPNINVFNTIEEEIEVVVRKCTNQEATETSWDKSCYVSFDNSNVDYNGSHFISATMTPLTPDDEESLIINKANTSSQTELLQNDYKNVFNNINISFNNDFSLKDSLSDNSEHCANTGYKHNQHKCLDIDDNLHYKLHKKPKCVKSTSSSTYGVRTDMILNSSSASEVSFKSVNSNNSFRIKKRRIKSNSNLFRGIFQKSKKNKPDCLDNSNTPSDTPRKERSRRTVKNKAWKFMDLCTWIGMKGLKSFSSLSGLIREPDAQNNDKLISGLMDDMRNMREIVQEVTNKQLLCEREKDLLKDEMQKMSIEIDDLKNKLKTQENQKITSSIPPPPPPPPPPPLPPLPNQTSSQSKLTRSNTIPRCGSAPPRISGPRLTITPEDIANVKLRKTRAHSVRAQSFKEGQQPLVTEQMLVSTRAKLGRVRRSVAAPTPSSAPPNKQLSDLEKCLLQEPVRVSSLHRQRSVRNTFRSAEELRMRPYPAARCSRSPGALRSPQSPRAKSIPRIKCNSLLELSDYSTTES